MTAKEYLQQAKHLDIRIDSKLEMLSSLHALATKCTSVMTGMPHSLSTNQSNVEATILKIIDLEKEIDQDIDALVDLKREMIVTIRLIKNVEYQTILEKRYLNGMSWGSLAVDMNYSVRRIHQLHGEALEALQDILEKNKTLHKIALNRTMEV